MPSKKWSCSEDFLVVQLNWKNFLDSSDKEQSYKTWLIVSWSLGSLVQCIITNGIELLRSSFTVHRSKNPARAAARTRTGCVQLRQGQLHACAICMITQGPCLQGSCAPFNTLMLSTWLSWSFYYRTRCLHFHFALDPANYITGPACTTSSDVSVTHLCVIKPVQIENKNASSWKSCNKDSRNSNYNSQHVLSYYIKHC